MSTDVLIRSDAQGQLCVALRQGKGEVLVFVCAVLGVIGALLVLEPRTRDMSTVLLVVGGAAVAWSAIALSAVETYIFDGDRRTVTFLRSSWLGRARKSVAASDVHAVQQVMRGPDDDRRLLELVSEQGVVRLQIPHRFNTLSGSEQGRLGSAIARHLDVPLRGMD